MLLSIVRKKRERPLRIRLELVIAASILIPGPLAALTPDGEELALNSVTSGVQTGADLAPVGTGFVAVWQSQTSPGNDASGSSVLCRLFTADGRPLGDEVQVNTTTAGDQISPAVASGPGGDFVVVWESPASPSDGFFAIQAQRFGSDGSKLGAELSVNSYTTNAQEQPAVAVASNGDFLVVWQSFGSFQDDVGSRSIQGQLYASSGVPVGGELQVNAYTTGDQAQPAVAALNSGSFVVSWFNVAGSPGDDDDGRSVQARLVSAAGSPLDGDFQVNTWTAGHQYGPAVAAGVDGGFLVVWSSATAQNDVDWAVMAREFDELGSASASELQVNTFTPATQAVARVAAGHGGEYAVVWRSGDAASDGPDGHLWSIAGRTVTAGAGSSEEAVINEYTTGLQGAPVVAGLGSGRFVVAWSRYTWPDHYQDREVFARVASGASVFVDGFESGDDGAWSSSLR